MAQTITSGLIGYYPFNGSADDESGNGFNGTVNNAVLDTDRNGNPQKAYKFNGNGDEIIVDDNSVLDNAGKSITISCWVKPTSTWESDYRAAVAGKGGWDLNKGYELLIRGDLAIEWNIITQSCGTNSYKLPLNTYTHLVAVFDDTKDMSYIYINSELLISSYTTNTIVDSDSPLTIGRRCDGNNFVASFMGIIDDISIYDKALSQSQVELLYKGISVLHTLHDSYILSGSNYVINWLKNEDISTVDLSYTTNNGSVWTSIATDVQGTGYNWTVSAALTDSFRIRAANHVLPSQYDETPLISILDNALDYGLYAYYPLNGNTDDASGKGNDVHAYNTSDTSDNNGFSNRALYFDSSDDTMAVRGSGMPDKTGNEGTVSMWVRKADWATTVDEVIIENRKDGGISQFYLSQHNYSNIGLHYRYGSNGAADNRLLAYPQSRDWEANSWHQVAFSWKREGALTYLKLFVDGTSVAESSTPLLLDEKLNWTVSGTTNPSTYNLNGSVDEIRLYNRALSEELLYKIYQDGLPMKITVPEEGTDLIKGTQQTIQWHVPYGIDNINIDFSADSGTSWNSVANNVSASLASVTWNVPAQTSDSCLFRVSTFVYPSVYLKQDRLFRIVNDSSKLNLVYYYKLNGNAADSSGRENHGILHGASEVNGYDESPDGAYLFNGTSDYMEVPASVTANLDKFTFSCWIRTTETNSSNDYWSRPHIFGNSIPDPHDRDFGIVTNNGYPGLWSGLNPTGDNSVISKFFLSDNNWHNLVCTYNGKIIKLYVDGKDIDCSLKATQPLNDYGYWLMVQHNQASGTTYYHQGTVDEVKLYSINLDTAAIKKLYNSYIPLQILTPGYRQDIIAGSQQIITWQNTNSTLKVDLDYSVDNGKNWTNIASDLDPLPALYNWTTPATAGDSCRIRITAHINSGNSITSEQQFRIVNDLSYVNLVAWYPFTTDASDSSGYRHDGEVYGARLVSLNPAGTDMAYSFNGVNNYIEVADMPQLQQFSLTVWFKTSNTSGVIYSMTRAGYLSVNTSDISNPGRMVASVENPDASYSNLIDTVIITDDKWHFAALTVSLDTLKLYVDNRLVKAEAVKGRIDYNNSGALIGVYDEHMNLYFKGLIDDVRLYRYAIDKNTVSYLFNDVQKICLIDPVTVNAGSDQIICHGVPVIFNATGTVASYTWNNGVTDGVSFTPSVSGYYVVSGIASNGCSATDTLLLTLIDCPVSGLNDQSADGVFLYPNPSTGNIYINSGSDLEIEDIKIYDFSGSLIKTDPSCVEDRVIKNLPEGQYIIKIITNKGVIVQKQLIN